MRFIVAVVASIFVSVAWTATAQAQAKGTESGLEEIHITAKLLEDTLPEQLERSGVKVEVIDSQQIRDGGYLDVAGTLQALAPGLYVFPKNGPFDYADISLQGSRTSDVLWLVDGVRVNNRLYAGTVPLDTLPSAMVDRIEVLEGGQALFYGTEAIAGAVNIVTKPFSATPTGTATLGVDTNNARHLDFNFANGTRLGQFVLYGSEDRSRGFKAYRDEDYQASATDRRRGYDVTTLGAKYAVDFNEQVRLSASYQRTDADLDNLLPFRVARNVNARTEDFATLKLDVQATPKLGFFIKSYYHNWHTDFDTFYNDLATPGLINAIYQDAFWGYKDRGINVLGKYDFAPGLEAYFGYDMQRYGGKDEVLVIEQNDETTQAVFAQLRLLPALVPNLTLAAGVRYNRPNVGEQATVWNFSGQYRLPADLYIKGQVGTNFRLPSAEELFANDPFYERGNPNLKPERSKSVNLSFGGTLLAGMQQLRWELTGFARDIDDLIGYADELNAEGQEVFENVPGVVRTRGGEVQVGADLQTVSVNGSYTYSRTTDDSGRQLDRIPRQLFKAGLDYHPTARPFGATATLNYTGDVTRTIGGTEFNYGRFVVLDLSGRYYPDADHHQQLNLSIHNALDRKYGAPARGCADVATDGPFDCSSPYFYQNLGLPRTFALSYTYRY